MADINLTGDASSLIRAVDQAAIAFVNFEQATSKVIKDQATFSASGKAVTRTLVQIDEAGNKVVTTFANVKGQLSQTSNVTRGASNSFKVLASQTALAAEAQALLTKATALGAEALVVDAANTKTAATAHFELAASQQQAALAREANIVAAKTLSGAMSAERAQTALNAKSSINLSDALELEAIAAIEAAAAQVTLAEAEALRARAATIQAGIAGVASRAPGVAKAQTKQLGDEDKVQANFQALERKRETDRLAAIKKQEAARIASEKRVAAEFFALDKKRETAQLASDRRIINERFAGNKKVATDRLTAIQRQQADRIAAEKRVAAAFLALDKQRKSAQLASDRQTINTRFLQNKKVEGARLVAIKKQITEREVAEKRVAAQFLALDKKRVAQQLADDRRIISERFAQNQKTEAARLVAIKKTNAQRIIDEKRISAEAKKTAASSNRLVTSLVSLSRLIGISLLIGGTFRLVQAFTDATRAAGQLSIKIAEIETITTSNTFSTAQWADGLRELSNSFGIDTLAQAEGAYQILSRQIKNAAGETIQGAEALKFLEVANRLAVTGVTDTATATNLLTASINSFKLVAEDAESVAVKLFKTVELGALRIEDISDILGRVAVPANQLGISLDELLGSIDGITRQGFKADEAITAIRNVILKLIKPTEAGKDALEALGAASGQALIEARGFIPGLEAFLDEVGNTVEGVGEGFGRLRAIIGALALTGKNAELTADSIRQIKDASVDAFNDDTRKIIESTGQQLKRAGEEAQNFFEKSFGQPILRSIAEYIKGQEGIVNVLKNAVENFKLLTATVAITILTIKLLTGASASAAISLTVLEVVALEVAGAYTLATRAVAAFNASVLASPLGVFLAIGAALAVISQQAKTLANEQLKAAEDANLAVLKLRENAAKSAEALNRRQIANTQEAADESARAIKLSLQNQVADLNKLVKANETASEKITDSLKLQNSEFTRSLTKEISEQKKAFKRAEKNVEKSTKEIGKRIRAVSKIELEISLVGGGFGQQLALIGQELQRAQADQAIATEQRDLKAFKIASARTTNLTNQKIDAAIKLNREEVRLDIALRELRAKSIIGTSRLAQSTIQARIKAVQRLQRLLKTGSKAQLEAAKDIQKLQETFEKADTADQFKKAFEELKKIRQEQEAIERSAQREALLRRDAALQQQEEQLQLQKIRQAEEKRAALAAQEQRRLETLLSNFKALSAEADRFNRTEVFKLDTEKEIINAVTEQQTLLGKISAIQNAIGGGVVSEQLTRRRSSKLQEATELELNRRQIAAADEIEAARTKAFKTSLEQANTLSNANSESIRIFLENLKGVGNQFGNLQLGGDTFTNERLQQSRNLQGFGISDSGDTGLESVTSIERNAAELQKGIARLVQLIDISRERPLLQTRPEGLGSISEREEFVQLFSKFNEFIQNIPGRNLDVLSQAGDDFSKALAGSIQTLVGGTGSLGTSGIGNAITGRSSQQEAIRLASLQNAQIGETLKQRDNERLGIADSTEAFDNNTKKLETFGEFLEAAQTSISEGKEFLTREAPSATAPGLQPGNIDDLAKPQQAAIEKADKDSKKARAQTIKDLSQLQAESTAKALLDERQKIQSQLVKLNQDAIKPASVLDQEFQRKKINTSIRFGPGEQSVNAQQASIKQQIEAENTRERAFNKARKEQENLEKAERRTAAIASGATGVSRDGQLIARGRGNTDINGNPIARGRGNTDSNGNLIAGGRISPGQGAVAASVKTGTDGIIAEQKRTNELLNENKAETQRAKDLLSGATTGEGIINTGGGDFNRGLAAEQGAGDPHAATGPGVAAGTSGLSPTGSAIVKVLQKFLTDRDEERANQGIRGQSQASILAEIQQERLVSGRRQFDALMNPGAGPDFDPNFVGPRQLTTPSDRGPAVINQAVTINITATDTDEGIKVMQQKWNRAVRQGLINPNPGAIRP